MKKFILILFTFLLLTGCSSKDKLDFNDLEEIKYLKQNKNKIESVIFRQTTLGSRDCYQLDKEETYNFFINIEVVKESNISVTDNYITYIFSFENGEEVIFNFESNYFRYKDKNYKIKDFSHIRLNEDQKQECND